jgi:hypothetical protein
VTAWDIWGTAGAQGGRPLGLGICKDAWARGAGLRVWAPVKVPGLEGPTSPPALPRGGPSGPQAPGRGGVGRGRVSRGGGRRGGGDFFFPAPCRFDDLLQGTQDSPCDLGSADRERAAGPIGISLRGRRGPLKASSSISVARPRTLTLVGVVAAGYASCRVRGAMVRRRGRR